MKSKFELECDGYDAYFDKLTNPYEPGDDAYFHWQNGFKEAELEDMENDD